VFRLTSLVVCCYGGLLAAPYLVPAQSTPPLPACEPSIRLRQALDEKLKWKLPQGWELSQLVKERREVLAGLIAEYPREIEPHRRLILETRWWADPNQLPALVERYQKDAVRNPADPLALFLAGLALYHTDTSESIRLLEAARSLAPKFPWPALELAEIYADDKHADKAKASENLTAFFSICPSSTDPRAQFLLGKLGGATLQAQVASALRTRLAKEADTTDLTAYETLWGLEFRSRPPQQHDALRKVIATDVKRLEFLIPRPNADQLALLIEGSKQSGAPPEIVAAAEDRLLRQFPRSEEAYPIPLKRWQQNHHEPEDQSDAPAWATYNKSYRQALRNWMLDAPNVPSWGSDWFWAIFGENDPTVSEVDGISAMQAYRRYYVEWVYLRAARKYVYAPLLPAQDLGAAEFLIRHAWQPERALALLRNANASLSKERERMRQDDDLSANQMEDQERQVIDDLQDLASVTLDAAKLVGRPEEALMVEQLVEGPVPTQRGFESDYWWNRAKLAALEGHNADALAYFQLALRTRLVSPRPFHGKLIDELTNQTRQLWKNMGGSETAWAAWNISSSGGIRELTEVQWKRPPKQLPPFELADLSGKTWRLKELGGKSLLINLWATWCGGCREELPFLQKLYENTKGRADIQILAFNIDEDLGGVAPFLKEKGYTFPVLPAYGFVKNLLGDSGWGIPQNWIVDPTGTWRWVQEGFDTQDPDWMKKLIQRLEALKASD